MDSQKVSLHKRAKSLIFAFGLSAVVFIILNIIIPARYEMADDFVLSQFLAEGRTEFVFSNILLQKVFVIIQQWVYPWNAYVIISFIFAVGAFTLVAKIFIDKFGLLWGCLTAALLQAVFAVSYATVFSFTTFAAVYSATGLFGVVHYAREKKPGGMICGAILSVLGALYRLKIFETVFVVAAVFVFALCISDFLSTQKKERSFLKFVKIVFEPRRAICAVCILILAFSSSFVSNKMFKTPEMQDYRAYNSARSTVFDYEIVPYEQAKQEYDAVGIDANDLQMTRYCMFDKDGGLSLEQLKSIRQISNSEFGKQNRLISSTKSMIATQIFEVLRLTTEGITVGVIILAFIVYCVLQKKAKILPACIIIAALVPFYIYLYAQGRAPYRVVYGMLLIALLGMIYLIDEKAVKEKFENKKALKTTLCIVCCILSLGCLLFNIKNVPQAVHPASESEAAAIHEMQQNQDLKYEFFGIETMSMDVEAEVKDVYHIAKVDRSSNLFNQPSTYYLTPLYCTLLENFGTDNAYRNLLNENVYAVFKNTEDRKDIESCMQQYLQKYYAEGKTVTMKKVKTYDAFSVYKYTLV